MTKVSSVAILVDRTSMEPEWSACVQAWCFLGHAGCSVERPVLWEGLIFLGRFYHFSYMDALMLYLLDKKAPAKGQMRILMRGLLYGV